jgi:hypothetical protein
MFSPTNTTKPWIWLRFAFIILDPGRTVVGLIEAGKKI